MLHMSLQGCFMQKLLVYKQASMQLHPGLQLGGQARPAVATLLSNCAKKAHKGGGGCQPDFAA